jgi:hypothetical protein
MKYEGIVILFGVGSVIVLLTIYLIAKAKNSRKVRAEESKMESISAIKVGRSIVEYPASEKITMTGTFPSSNPKWTIGATSVDEVKSSHIEKIKKIKKKQAPMNDYLVEEDKSLLRRVETRDGDFLTSMLVCDMMNSDDNNSHSTFYHSSNNDFDYGSSSSSDYSSSSSSDYSSSDSSSWDSGSSFDSSSSCD